MIIVGINAYHGDSSAALVIDGEVLCAVEEERFTRVKHWAGFPSMAIKYCLKSRNISPDMVDFYAINRKPKSNNWRRVKHLLTVRPSLKTIMERTRNRKEWANVHEDLHCLFPDAFIDKRKVHFVEHHDAHLASAYLSSPFDRAAVLSVDGAGDFKTTAWGLGEGNTINRQGDIDYPHSLGIFYLTLTQYLGFPHYGDEYKVMGMAAYGDPQPYKNKLLELIDIKNDGTFSLNLKAFRHTSKNIISEWGNGTPVISSNITNFLIDLLGEPRDIQGEVTQRHMDIAAATQEVYELALLNIVNNVFDAKLSGGNLTIAGGCGNNSLANGKIYNNTKFNRLYVHAAAGDAGGAIGAALHVGHIYEKDKRPEPVLSASLGPEYTHEQCQNAIGVLFDDADNIAQKKIDDQNALCQYVAEKLAAGLVVGWFQGKAEWGPRALGNRSILADPRRQDMKDILNLKIKRREAFRPFAPSVLKEKQNDWFELNDDVPFMMQVSQVKESKRNEIPAVVHVDGSARIQTVSKEHNAKYYNLIKAFEEITNVPIVLNTSFNENEPIVCTPDEAIQCFKRTKMDILVLGTVVIERL